MIVPLTRQGRLILARGVEALRADPRVTFGIALFDQLPVGDRARLLEAAPEDVFATAVRAWRDVAPGLKRDLAAGILVLQSRRISPKIAEAQKRIRGGL